MRGFFHSKYRLSAVLAIAQPETLTSGVHFQTYFDTMYEVGFILLGDSESNNFF